MLTVRCNVVVSQPHIAFPRKPHAWRASLECWLRLHRNRHHFVSTAIEDFTAVRGPARILPASRRDHPLSTGSRKWLHVNLPLSRFVRRIGDPVAIWRKLSGRYVERGPQKRLNLIATIQRERLDSQPSRIGVTKQERLAIGRHRYRRGSLVVERF